MQKVVVVGALGMAGHIITEYLESSNQYEVYGIARNPGANVTSVIDVNKHDDLRLYLDKVKPDYVINCAGVLVKESAENICNAILVNSYLPQFLSKLALDNGFKLVHLSTDCVFSGINGGYSENSFRDGDGNYARSKALGEVIHNRDLTIRTSIIGPELKKNGTGLFDWFMRQESVVTGYNRVYWSGVTTLELAKAIHQMIIQDISGIYNLCSENKVSKYDLLDMIKSVWSKNIEINTDSRYRIDKSLICTRTDFDYFVPDYMEMLNTLKSWIISHEAMYPAYYTK